VDITNYLGKSAPTVPVSFTKKDLILYAIGIGCTELNFVYVSEIIIPFNIAAMKTLPISLHFLLILLFLALRELVRTCLGSHRLQWPRL
jgi:hypothetical protein